MQIGKFGLERLHRVLSATELVRDRARVRTKPSVSRRKDKAGGPSGQRTPQVHKAAEFKGLRLSGASSEGSTGAAWGHVRFPRKRDPDSAFALTGRRNVGYKRWGQGALLETRSLQIACLADETTKKRARRPVSGRDLWSGLPACSVPLGNPSRHLLKPRSAETLPHAQARALGTLRRRLRGFNQCFGGQRGCF